MRKILQNKKVRWILYTIAALFLVFILFIASIYVGLWGKLPSKKELQNIDQAEASLVFDSNDKLLGKYFIFDREGVSYEELPKHLINALISTEDVRFYKHNGVDLRSFARVFFKTLLLQNESSGGGSTITQQLVKNLYGRKDYGFLSLPVNKFREMIVAGRIENIYSKEQIIALYFNTVPFSDNTFGIESAARKFFNTTTPKLTLSQSATLIGTLKASHSYNPRLFPERSRLRRDVVLSQMEKYGFITSDLFSETLKAPLETDYHPFDYDDGIAPYFRERIRLDMAKVLDSLNSGKEDPYDLYKDGLRIYTTLDYGLQEFAEKAVVEHMKKLQMQFEKSYGKNAPWLKDDKLILDHVRKLPEYKSLSSKGLDDKKILESLNEIYETPVFSYEGDTILSLSTIDSLKYYLKFLNTGFVAMDPNSGAIKSYVGGINFEHFKYDHVSSGKRQVGSTFKPIVYSAAVESGISPCSYFSLEAVTYEDQNGWTPRNASSDETDPYMNYSLANALAHSINTISVKVLDAVGIDAVINQAKRMGINSKLPEVPSLALGTAELSLIELATAYTSFVNSGKHAEPYFIDRIEDKDGKVIYKHQNKNDAEVAFNENTREAMIEMMKAVVNEGTAQRLRSVYGLRNDIAGKTGTTQNNKDGWFVGVTPKLVMAAWVGNDDHRIGFRSTAMGQGANSALPIVAQYINQYNSDENYKVISLARFNAPSEEVLSMLDCDPEKRDGFFKRLFTSKNNEEKKENVNKKKKGFFSFLKRKKDKDN